MEILKLLKFISETLNKLQIPYMLAGSMAMNFYAVSRATRDIDIVVNLKEKDVELFLSNLDNFYYNKNTILQEIKRKGMFNIIDNVTGFKVDLMILKETEYTLQAFQNRKIYDDLGFDVFVTSIEDLIIAKIQWIQQLYSDRQENDIKMLLQNPDKDINYLKNWIKKLNLKIYNLVIE
jgi:hypothetical protein